MKSETRFETVDQYIASFPKGVQAVLEQVRNAIHEGAPGAVESISYNMPTLDYKGRLLHFAAFKEHYSVFAVTPAVERKFAKQLAQYEVGRGTIRFPYGTRVPTELIAGIAAQRAQENARAQK